MILEVLYLRELWVDFGEVFILLGLGDGDAVGSLGSERWDGADTARVPEWEEMGYTPVFLQRVRKRLIPSGLENLDKFKSVQG